MEKKEILETPVSKILEYHNIYTCAPDDTLESVVRILVEKKVGALLITDDKKTPLGIFTERDYLTKIPLGMNKPEKIY